jgi:hypothetical protein
MLPKFLAGKPPVLYVPMHLESRFVLKKNRTCKLFYRSILMFRPAAIRHCLLRQPDIRPIEYARDCGLNRLPWLSSHY